MPNCCVPICTSDSRRDKISFHEFPSDASLRDLWLKTLSREDFVPNSYSASSVVCGKHFQEADYFPNRKRRCLKPGVVPSRFDGYPSCKKPVAVKERLPLKRTLDREAGNSSVKISKMMDSSSMTLSDDVEEQVTKKSKKQPRDPSTLRSARLLEPLVILEEGSNRPKGQPRLPVVLGVTPIAVEKVRKLSPWPEPDAQVKKETENEPLECPIVPPEVESISVGPTKESEKQPQDIVEIALRNAIDGLSSNEEVRLMKGRFEGKFGRIVLRNATEETSSNGPKAPAKDSLEDPKKKAPGTADGATNSVMMVNLVCPHCQKACKVCLNVKPQSLETNAPTHLPQRSQPTDFDNKPPNNSNDNSSAAMVRKLEAKVQELEKQKLWMLKKVKVLHQSVRRLKARQDTPSKRKKSVRKEEDLMVIGTINGVLNNS